MVWKARQDLPASVDCVRPEITPADPVRELDHGRGAPSSFCPRAPTMSRITVSSDMISLSADSGEIAPVVPVSTVSADTAEEPELMHPDRQRATASAKRARLKAPLFSTSSASVRSIAKILPLQPGGMKEDYDGNRVKDW